MYEPCKHIKWAAQAQRLLRRKGVGIRKGCRCLALLQRHAFSMGLVSRAPCGNLACRPQLEQHHLRSRCCSSVRGLQAACEQSEPAQAGVHPRISIVAAIVACGSTRLMLALAYVPHLLVPAQAPSSRQQQQVQ